MLGGEERKHGRPGGPSAHAGRPAQTPASRSGRPWRKSLAGVLCGGVAGLLLGAAFWIVLGLQELTGSGAPRLAPAGDPQGVQAPAVHVARPRPAQGPHHRRALPAPGAAAARGPRGRRRRPLPALSRRSRRPSRSGRASAMTRRNGETATCVGSALRSTQPRARRRVEEWPQAAAARSRGSFHPLQRRLQLEQGRLEGGAALVVLLHHLRRRLGDEVRIRQLGVDLPDLGQRTSRSRAPAAPARRPCRSRRRAAGPPSPRPARSAPRPWAAPWRTRCRRAGRGARSCPRDARRARAWSCRRPPAPAGSWRRPARSSRNAPSAPRSPA